ncbi:MAG: hypothetical protein AB8E15_12365 [Bdellovibrionales bacterium]
MSDLNYLKIQKEVLRGLRQGNDQRTFSEELGYSFNQVGKWEAGKTKFKFNDFYGICEKSKSLEVVFADFFHEGLIDPSPKKIVARILFLFSKDIPPSDSTKSALLGELTHRGPAIEFHKLLQLISTKKHLMLSFVNRFMDIKENSNLYIEHQRSAQLKEIVINQPNIVLLFEALKLKQYLLAPQHSSRLLSIHANTTRSSIDGMLIQLENLRVIEWKDAKFRVMDESAFEFYHIKDSRLNKNTKYSVDLASERYMPSFKTISENPIETVCQASVNFYAVSKNASKKIAEQMDLFQQAVSSIVKNDVEQKEGVQVIVLNSFPSNKNSPYELEEN